MGYLDYAGLQYLWSKLKEKFAPKSHSHDDRYYTESEMDGKLNSKVNNNEAGANGLINKLSTADGIPNDATVFISQHNDGKTASYYRRPISTLWTYIKSKADSVYQPKGSYAASSHTHDDRYYTETEINSKLNGKAVNITLSKVDLNTVKTPGFYNADGGNGCTNVPVSDAFGLIVTHNANGEYYTQIFFLVDKNTSYRRYCNGGTWSGWTQDKYTDTNTWRGIQNNLTSDSTSDSLSAAQGKALKALVDGKLGKNEKAVDSAKLGGFPLNDIKKYFNGVPSIRNDGVMEVGKYIDFHTTSDDTSDYAARITAEKTGLTISGTTKGTFSGSLSGNASTATSATTASKLSTSAGSAAQPVYFKDGVPVATTYTLNKTVPADAKFTDTNTWRGIQDNLTSNSKDQSLSAAQGKALKTLVDGKAAVGHTHNSVKDAGDNSSNTTFAYSKSGMNYGDYSWLAGWNGYELRAINKNQFATAGHNHDSRYYTESEIDSKLDDKSNVGHTHDYLPTAGGTMNGTITFSDSSHGKIYSGPTDNVNGPGGDLNNIVIESWNGLSFTTGCPNQTYTGKTAVGIDCREGVVKAARFDGTLTGTAATLGGGGNPYAPMTFNWSGKDGQPTWLWGGEDGTNMYVYNPGNFSVNWAQSAENGVYANGFKSSRGGYIRFCNGLQICWGENNKNTTAAVFDVPFKTVDYTLVLGGTDDLKNAWYIASRTTTGFTPKQNGFAGVTNWIAIGRWN